MDLAHHPRDQSRISVHEVRKGHDTDPRRVAGQPCGREPPAGGGSGIRRRRRRGRGGAGRALTKNHQTPTRPPPAS
jgi:hypothetical protein